MNIFYDIPTESWYHDQESMQLFAGAEKEEIHYKQNQNNQTLIPISIFPGSRMLVVGILTSLNPKKESGIGGNLTLFQDLSLYLLEHGILVFVFTVETFHSIPVKGFLFPPFQTNGSRLRCRFPI